MSEPSDHSFVIGDTDALFRGDLFSAKGSRCWLASGLSLVSRAALPMGARQRLPFRQQTTLQIRHTLHKSKVGQLNGLS
jgi:hypothetical protein